MIYKIFDNGGKTFDRYTILTEPWHEGKSCDAFAMSENPKDVLGFNQYVGDVFYGADLGKEVQFDDLPCDVRDCILERVNNYN